ncbi:MAG TPA: serine protease [Nitrospiraceae bacterium]|nr:serine protease [Nitrospiraceae bacterium]
MMRSLKRWLGVFVLAMFLAGCSSGGGAPLPPEAPAAPSLTAHDGYIAVSWTAVSGASSYNIYWSTTTGVTKATGSKISNVTAPPLDHGGLVNGTPYFYVVTAANAGGESAESPEASQTPADAGAGADPLYTSQWHLNNGTTPIEDVNVVPAWSVCGAGNTCRGEGIRIAVVDNGLEIGHEDLAANVAAGLSYNYVTGSSDPTGGAHGTSVAGVAAARDLNGLGVRGVAPRANLVGYNLLQSPTVSNKADAMTRNAVDVHISSNSWGPPDGYGTLDASSLAWKTAINTGLTTGRGGLGSIYTWAGGNGDSGVCPAVGCYDNSNYDGYANNRGVMAICAVGDNGFKASYSERGANLWVCAHSSGGASGITTTDRTDTDGYNTNTTAAGGDYYSNFGGTSSATPLASGVVALMLQAKPSLGWRDVRLILAQTARQNDAGNAEWTVNAAGYNINHNYGFGTIDADAAVTLAKTWTNVGAEVTYTTALSAPNQPIPDNNATGVSDTITVSGSGISTIEFVEVTFTAANHTYSGDLEITLTGPSGTDSIIAETHVCPTGCSTYSGWVFGSARHLSEAVNGDWILTVKDGAPPDTGTFQSWSLKFYGR